MTTTKKPQTAPAADHFEFYRDGSRANDWRWKRKAAGNHELIGASSEGYRNLSECTANAVRNGYDASIHTSTTDLEKHAPRE